jgi:hypothetical protein
MTRDSLDKRSWNAHILQEQPSHWQVVTDGSHASYA